MFPTFLTRRSFVIKESFIRRDLVEFLSRFSNANELKERVKKKKKRNGIQKQYDCSQRINGERLIRKYKGIYYFCNYRVIFQQRVVLIPFNLRRISRILPQVSIKRNGLERSRFDCLLELTTWKFCISRSLL